MSRAADWLRVHAFWLWPAVGIIAAAVYAIVIVRPFSPSSAADETANVASSWNQSIAKLGILPLYPPQEDFYVGDIWAVIVGNADKTYLSKAVRIGHIDLTEQINNIYNRRMLFDDHLDPGVTSSDFLKQQKLIHPFLVAFPGISVSQAANNGASSVLPFFSFNVSRTGEVFDNLKIPAAQSYGLDPTEAILKLIEYCTDEQTKIRCYRTYLDNILSDMIDERLVKNSSQTTEVDVRLELITRVYLTSSIEHTKIVKDAKEGGANEAAVKVESGQQVGDQENKANIVSAKVLHTDSSTSEITFSEKFSRPLAFGYRAAIIYPIK